MVTTTKMTFEEFLQLPDDRRYELNEGELLVTPSPTPYHNIVRSRIKEALTAFVRSHRLGLVLDESDFHLGGDTVRRPDIAFLATTQLQGFNLHRSPVEGAPTLAIEVISPSNSAEDILLRVHQLLASGSSSVWVFYPGLALAVIHDPQGTHEVRGTLQESKLFGGRTFNLSLAEIFNQDYMQ
jgi:Uma2 family endonuclease